MTHTSCEMVWIKNLLMKFDFSQLGSMPMHCDNQSAIYIAQNPVFHERTKHIEIDCHVVRDVWTKKVIFFSSHIFLSKLSYLRYFLNYVTS